MKKNIFGQKRITAEERNGWFTTEMRMFQWKMLLFVIVITIAGIVAVIREISN